MKSWKFRIFIINILFFTISCSKNLKDEVSEQSKARRLMNESRYEEATLSYQAILDENPENESARIELASSYVARAGVDIYSLFPLLEKTVLSKPLLSFGGNQSGQKKINSDALSKKQLQLNNNSDNKEELKSEDQSADQSLEKDQYVNELASKYFKVLMNLSDNITNLALIPNVDDEHEILLWKATETLNYNFQNKNYKYQANNYTFVIYSLIISKIIKGFLYFDESLDAFEMICQKNPTEINNDLTKIHNVINLMGKTFQCNEVFDCNNRLKLNFIKLKEMFSKVFEIQEQYPNALVKLSEIRNSICL